MKKIIAIGTCIGVFGLVAVQGIKTHFLTSGVQDQDVRLAVDASMNKTPAVNQSAVGAPSARRSSPNGPYSIPEIAEAQAVKAEVNLWHVNHRDPDTLFDGNPAKRLQVDPSDIETFHVGQKLRLHIPQRDAELEAVIASTYNLNPRTQIWQGQIAGGHPQDNIIVTRGQIETHITIATIDGTFSAVIDNATGDTVMVDEADIIAAQIPHEDGIAVDPLDHQPPFMVP